MQLSRLPTGRLHMAANCSSLYEAIDSDLHSYVMLTDAKAWHRYLHGIKVCPFCAADVTLNSACCRRFAEFRQATAAASGMDKSKRGSAAVPPPGSRIVNDGYIGLCAKSGNQKLGGKEDARRKGRKFDVKKDAKWRTKDHLADRSV